MANGIEFNQNTASVFNSNSLDFELESQQLTQKNSSNSYSPLLNLQNELAMITSSSLSETIEGLSPISQRQCKERRGRYDNGEAA